MIDDAFIKRVVIRDYRSIISANAEVYAPDVEGEWGESDVYKAALSTDFHIPGRPEATIEAEALLHALECALGGVYPQLPWEFYVTTRGQCIALHMDYKEQLFDMSDEQDEEGHLCIGEVIRGKGWRKHVVDLKGEDLVIQPEGTVPSVTLPELGEGATASEEGGPK